MPTVQVTALAGPAIDADKIPGNVQTLKASDLTRDGSASMTSALNAQLGSANFNDNLDDPFQPDVMYRGFVASPVLGTPQGLAVYQNGVRINEAFGDTVNWDLFPDMAIQRVDVFSASPVYGLNALGGAISVSMKNGFNFQGGEVELSGGSFSQRSAETQYGVNNGSLGFYMAARGVNQGTWRVLGGDSIRQLYTALSAKSDNWTLDLTYAHANNALQGQGATPVQELAVDRDLVFSGPQNNLNRLDFFTLNGTLALSKQLALQGVLYYRDYRQNVNNGNTTDYEGCTTDALAGSLCQSDGLTPVTNSAGVTIPDLSQGGAVAIGENDFEAIHSYGRGGTLQASSNTPLFALGNALTLGLSLDRSDVDFYSGVQIGALNTLLEVEPTNWIVDTPESSPGFSQFGGTPVSLKAINKSEGLYLSDTLDLSEEFALTAGGRYNWASVNLQDRLGSNLTGLNHYQHFNPALGLTYKLQPTMTVYGGLVENTRTPTASEIECSDPALPCLLPSNLAGDPPTLKQVVAHSVELGLRGHQALDPNVDQLLTWNLSAFRTNLENDIYGIATTVSRGFYQNIGSTRRQGLEAGLNFKSPVWSGFASYSYVAATFQSPLTLPSPANPYQDENGDIQVQPGNQLPGIPRRRLKLGADCRVLPNWTLGATLNVASAFYSFGNESNQMAPLPGHHVVNLHTRYQLDRHVELFVSVENLFNAKYANYGILSDPTGIGAPGIPSGASSNDPGVNNQFISPAPPVAVYLGVRIRL